ncbi:hypothetical protein AB0O91_25460 [Kitasatospora sp. NPDC089797]|uniref:hypothetical protein n=1 Tax=Kitasatospora sp. NPDC089797 TaxID=3155298 RepID=UPI00343D4681
MGGEPVTQDERDGRGDGPGDGRADGQGDGRPEVGHQPGDPTPVPGGQTGLLVGAARTSLGCLGELGLELVGGAVLAVLTTASLAAVLVLAITVHRASPAGAYALAALGLLGLLHGIRHHRRPAERRSRPGRITARVTGGLGVWLILCVGYASFGDVLDLSSGF